MSRFVDSYELREDLGKGAFSIVKRCVQRKTGQHYAVKIINKRRLTTRDLQKLEKEERICRKLQHSNIVQLHDVISEDLTHYLVFDLVTGGELFDEIVAREFYSEADASYCMQQVLDSIAYCHKRNVIHRDLKPENLLLASRAKDSAVKLADFGLAIEMQGGEDAAWYGFAGTPGYLSPEVIKREEYGKPIDIWACGVILYILLVGYPPFWDEDQKRLYAQIKMARYDFPAPEWSTVTDEAKQLIRQMLEPNPKKRITAIGALQHPWISQRSRIASTIHRQETIAGLRRFNAKRKLKGAILTTLIAARAKGATLFATQQADESKSNTDASIPEIQEPAESANAAPRETVLPPTHETDEVMKAMQSLLVAIRCRDFESYKKLCDDQMLSFTKDSGCQLLQGLSYQKFFFANVPPFPAENITMMNPHVQFLGDNAAYVCYIRLSQYTIKDSSSYGASELKETCIWEKKEGAWKLVHIHSS